MINIMNNSITSESQMSCSWFVNNRHFSIFIDKVLSLPIIWQKFSSLYFTFFMLQRFNFKSGFIYKLYICHHFTTSDDFMELLKVEIKFNEGFELGFGAHFRWNSWFLIWENACVSSKQWFKRCLKLESLFSFFE
jgi:hypothetical protein